MAYLSPPLTIIDNQSNGHPSIVSVPPAATWFDEDRQHFVALKGLPKEGWATDSVASGSVDYSELVGAFYSGATTEEYETDAEVVYYQAFGLPNDDCLDAQEKLDEAQSAFDAAKKAARGRNSLVTEVSVAFPLPRKLASVQSHDDASSTDAGSSVVRRIPLLAKFSESIDGVRYLALQFTSTMVRIINVQNLESPRGEEKHWTIDLSYDIHPVLSSPDKLPFFKEGREINTAIIGGGIIWCRGISNSINLILITTTAVIVYVMDSQTRTMKKSRVYPHQPATSFWFEANSRTLVIGSYISNKSDDGNFPKIVMDMKTLFFTENGNIETLPTFVVGSLRETKDEGCVDGSARSESSDSKQGNVVSPTDISLVYLHGDVYCVELGSLGSRKGIGFIKMDRENRCIYVRQHETNRLANESSQTGPLVGVVDNLLCIINQESKRTSFLDVHALFSDDQYIFKEIIEVACPSEPSGLGIHDESLSFLAPNFFLHTDGEGLLYEIKLDIKVLLQSIPLTACIVPFLLRRGESKRTMTKCIVERLDKLIEKNDLSTLKIWFGVMAREYSKSAEATKWDLESSDEVLLSAASLLHSGELSISDEIIVGHPSCQNVFTQGEMLYLVLLRHSMLAIKTENTDRKYLDFVSSVAIQYLIEIERNMATPCYALQCLIIALLVRQHRESELKSYLTTRETQWVQLRRKRQMNLPVSNGLHFDHQPNIAIVYSEIMFKIADTCTCVSLQHRLITHATSILIGCNANTTAARCLLSAGLIEDAIAVCSKKNRPQKDIRGNHDTIQASDFFNATTDKARAMTSEAEKCQLFYHLQQFLHQSFPDAFTRESRKVKAARRSSTGRKASFSGDNDTIILVEQSKLAHECKFPDDLFGGSSSSLCRRIRTMFGYFNSVKP